MSTQVPHIEGSDNFDLPIVGESHYQNNLERIAGPRRRDGVRHECVAELHLESNNPHDRNAVRVRIDGMTVGFIARDMALEVRIALANVGIGDGQRVSVDAVIAGGRLEENYGVWLDLNLQDDDGGDDDDDGDDEAAPPPVIKPSKYGSPATTEWGDPVRKQPVNPADFQWESKEEQKPAKIEKHRAWWQFW